MNSPSDINSPNATPAGGHNESTSSPPVSPDLSVPVPQPNPSAEDGWVRFYFDDADPVAECACGWHTHGDSASDAFGAWWKHRRGHDDAAGEQRPVVLSARVDLDLEAIEARANAATAGSWGLSSSEATMNDRSSYRFGPRSQPPVFLASQMRFADAEFIAHAREDVPRLVAEVRRLREQVGLLEAERDPRVVDELRDLWQRALEREGNLASAVADVMWKAAQYGTTEDGDTRAYLVPKGCMHRLIGVAQQNGAHVPVSFRVSNEPIEDVDPQIERLTAERDAARAEAEELRQAYRTVCDYAEQHDATRASLNEARAEAERLRENAITGNEVYHKLIDALRFAWNAPDDEHESAWVDSEDMERQATALRAEVGRVREALQAARDLHFVCRACESNSRRSWCHCCDAPWPCATVRALDAALDGAE